MCNGLASAKDDLLEMDSLWEDDMDSEVEWLEGVEEELLETDLMWNAAMYEASVDHYWAIPISAHPLQRSVNYVQRGILSTN